MRRRRLAQGREEQIFCGFLSSLGVLRAIEETKGERERERAAEEEYEEMQPEEESCLLKASFPWLNRCRQGKRGRIRLGKSVRLSIVYRAGSKERTRDDDLFRSPMVQQVYIHLRPAACLLCVPTLPLYGVGVR